MGASKDSAGRRRPRVNPAAGVCGLSRYEHVHDLTHMPDPAASIVRGAAAGLAGTLAMDALWYRRYRRGGGEDGFLDWELSSATTSYEQAGAPAQVGKRIVEGYFQRELPPASAGMMNNAVHLLTGVAWGGPTRSSRPRRPHRARRPAL